MIHNDFEMAPELQDCFTQPIFKFQDILWDLSRTADCLSNANADAPDGAEEGAGEADEQALQGETSGVSMYKRIQASSAASLQRQKAARMQASRRLLQ